MDAAPDSFFVPYGDGRYVATELTRGPWDARAQHGGPPAALVGRELEVRHPREDAAVVRVTLELLGPVPLGQLTVDTAVARPGRSVELLVASVVAAGREVARAAAWRVRTADIGVTVSGAAAPPAAGPDAGHEEPFFPAEDVGYHTGMEVRFVAGSWLTPGPAVVWMRMRAPLVPDEPPSPLVRVLIAADSGNGVSAALDYHRYVFINPDLTVVLHRPAVGEWIALDARTTVEPHGIGVAESVVSDTTGALGRALQGLFVAPRERPLPPARS